MPTYEVSAVITVEADDEDAAYQAACAVADSVSDEHRASVSVHQDDGIDQLDEED